MKHKDKVKMARKMLTKEERKKGGKSIFESDAWQDRAKKRTKKHFNS